VWWLHIARDASQHAFAAEARQLLQRLPRAHEHVFYTSRDGRPSAATLASLGVPSDATAYVCGPAAFMTDMVAALGDLDIAAGRVHTELFGALPAINPGVTGAVRRIPHQPGGEPGTGPQITFARSGLTVRWVDGGRSLLELAEACDIPTRWSCRTGVCHTCVTPLLSGAVSYAPTPLEPPAVGEALICCARPTADVVLDL
jgi:ferredoxin-NADP reductase